MGRRKPSLERSLATLCPLQAEEWHPTLNGDLKPADVTPGSNEKVWWKCASCGKEWQATIANRAAKNSRWCRSCSMKARPSVKVGKSLLDVHPDIAGELHPTLNGGLSADQISSGSRKKVWWLCPACEHAYEMTPSHRTGRNRSRCPPCAYRRIADIQTAPKEGESFLEMSPELAASWHPSRNLPTTPGGIKNRSGFRAWWRCPECGHEWQTSVSNRTSGKRTGCPPCGRANRAHARDASQIAEPGKSLGDLHPELLVEWHPDRNQDLDPFRLKPASSVKAWWKCRDCAHEWQTTLGLRTTAGTGCAPCSYKQRGQKRRTPKIGQSLADLFPELIEEWDWEKNGDLDPAQLKPGSDLSVWWTCRRGHEWRVNIYTRTGQQRTGCFKCAHMPEEGKSFADLNPMTAREWHPTKNGDVCPDEVKPNSAYKAWWKCLARGHEWQAPVSNRSGSSPTSCPKCTMWGTSSSQIRIAYELIAVGIPIVLDHPRVPVSGRRPVAADMVIPDYKLIIEYDGSFYHARSDSLEKDRKQSRHLEEAGWTVLRIRPESMQPIDEFSIEIPNGASIKAISIATLVRINELGYPVNRLADYKKDPELWAAAESDAAALNLKSRSLLQEFPDIAAEWHPTLNGLRSPDDVNPGSKEPAWWLCKQCGHEWRVRPGHRTKGGSGCPECGRKTAAIKKRMPKPGNSLAEVYPRLLKIFHPDKNGDLDLYQVNNGAVLTIWWRCPDCGHEWKTRQPRNAGCRPCGTKRRALAMTTPGPGESLADLYPAVAAQWHPSKNGDLLPSQIKETHTKAVWWLCLDCDRSWKVSPRNRVGLGAGCRRCASEEAARKRTTPKPGKSLADKFPALVEEWNFSKNTEFEPTVILPGSARPVWWTCRKCGNEWKARIWTRTKKGFGCKRCASAQLSVKKRIPKPGKSLADVKPELLRLWHPTMNTDITPKDLTPSSHTRVWWRCPDCKHEWQATPAGVGCRPCSMKRAGQKRAENARAKGPPCRSGIT